MGEGKVNCIHSKLSCYQPKMDCYMYKMFHVSFVVTTKQKYTENTQKVKRKKSKYTTLDNHQFTKEDRKRV